MTVDYRKLSSEDLAKMRIYASEKGNVNAEVEIADFIRYYGKRVKVVKGRKVPIGTTGEVFWVKRYDYSRYGDPWGIYGSTKVGIKTDEGETYFTACNNIEVIKD